VIFNEGQRGNRGLDK